MPNLTFCKLKITHFKTNKPMKKNKISKKQPQQFILI